MEHELFVSLFIYRANRKHTWNVHRAFRLFRINIRCLERLPVGRVRIESSVLRGILRGAPYDGKVSTSWVFPWFSIGGFGDLQFLKIWISRYETTDVFKFWLKRMWIFWLFNITVSCLLVLQNQLPYDKISFMMNHDEVNHIENLKSTRVFHRPHMSSRSLITYKTIGAEILPCESTLRIVHDFLTKYIINQVQVKMGKK